MLPTLIRRFARVPLPALATFRQSIVPSSNRLHFSSSSAHSSSLIHKDGLKFQDGSPSFTSQDEWGRFFATRGSYGLPSHLNVLFHHVDTEKGLMACTMTLQPHHLAANGYCHAGTITTLADTTCGWGCISQLHKTDAFSFTTIELKINLMGTALEGTLYCEGKMLHGGKTTQVWDAQVYNNIHKEKLLAVFRCTQMLLKPKAKKSH